MSTHGICFDNGMSGNCNMDCEEYLAGNCDAHAEFVSDDMTVTEKREHYEIYNE